LLVGVPFINDNVHEDPEVFHFILSEPSGAGLGPWSDVPVTISDDDPVPVVTLEQGPYQIAEPGGFVPVYIHLSNPSASTAWVHALAQDSAPPNPQPSASAAAGDYGASNGWLPFSPGQTRNFFYVRVYDDSISEGTEYVDIAVPDANGAVVPGAPQ